MPQGGRGFRKLSLDVCINCDLVGNCDDIRHLGILRPDDSDKLLGARAEKSGIKCGSIISPMLSHSSATPVAAPTPPREPAPPEPSGWRYTGSWDASDSYTEGWGPEWGDDENPPSHHPLYHSIHGSNNTGTVGHLSITSGVNRGWIKASFSGAEVLTCSVANYDGSKALAGS